jgi:DNA-binding response OmpR family regulator
MKTVLIVDDEPDILVLLRLALEAAGYTTVEAADGQEALEVIRASHPDVVLLDVMMPRMDGWATLEHIAETGEHPRVIMVTAKTASRDRDRAMELGADDFVTKPFEPDQLVERMRRVLESSEA